MISSAIAVIAGFVERQSAEHHQPIAKFGQRFQCRGQFEIVFRSRRSPVLHADAVGHVHERRPFRDFLFRGPQGGSRHHPFEPR